LRELTISKPKTFFDLIWSQASITTWDGLCMNCYLPVIYPGSFHHNEDSVKLGRMTYWVSLNNNGFFKGMGQQILKIGNEEIPILEIREMIFEFQGDNYEF